MKTKLQFTLVLSLVVLLTSFAGKAQTSLGHLKGIFKAPIGKAYFFTDKKYHRLNLYTDNLEKSASIQGNWDKVPSNLDATLLYNNGKAYFFKGSTFYRYNFNTSKVDKTAKISASWIGVPNNIDAAVVHPNGKIYFFKGDTYYRYNRSLQKVDKTAKISVGWKGLPNSIDAAFMHTNGKIYFFKDNKYYRYNVEADRVDKTATVAGNWGKLAFSSVNSTTTSSKNNIRLKVTLTRIKSVQARDSDKIADFLLGQTIKYVTNGKDKKAIKSVMKRYRYYSLYSRKEDQQIAAKNTLIISMDNDFHIREGNERHYINNSLVFEISPKEINDKRAEFKIYTSLGENDGWTNGGVLGIPYLGKIFYDQHKKIKEIANNDFIDVNIYEVLDYLQHPNASKYSGKKYFNGGHNHKIHESGAFGDVMWFERANNNALKGTLEFGNNDAETYVRFYYRFELIP